MENPTDNQSAASPKPRNFTGARRSLDVEAIDALAGRCFPGLSLTTLHLEQLAERIIAKSASPVVDRTAYVTQAISRHTSEWRAVALDLVHGIRSGRLDNGNDF